MNPMSCTRTVPPLLAIALGVVIALVPVDRIVVPRDAQALIGLPFTPLSFAGVARRVTRRHLWAYGAMGAGAAAAGAAAASYNASAYNSAYDSAYHGAAAGAAAGAADAQAAPPPPPATSGPAVGTVVASLPPGCKKVVESNVIYEHCGHVYYQPRFMGSSVVYTVSNGP